MEDINAINSNRIQLKLNAAKEATDRNEKLLILRELFKVIQSGSDSVVDKIEEGVTINNFDEVQAALRNEFNKSTKKLVSSIKDLGLTMDEQNSLLEMIQADNKSKISDDFQTIVIKKPKGLIEVTNLDEIRMPTSMDITNLREITEKLEELKSVFNNIEFPTPQVNVEAPVVQVSPQDINIPELDLSVITDVIHNDLEKLRKNSVNKPLAVRLSDGKKWVEQIVAQMGAMTTAVAGFNEVVRIKNADGSFAQLPSGDSLSTPSSIVSGTKTVTSAGTAVQITATATSCKEVWLNADLGNTNPVVVGDSSVVAASGTEQGIVLIPGNSPIMLRISDLSKLWVDSQTSGDKLAYAYTT